MSKAKEILLKIAMFIFLMIIAVIVICLVSMVFDLIRLKVGLT